MGRGCVPPPRPLSPGARSRRRRGGWRPGIWDRTPYDQWVREGRRGALEDAEERARDILRTPAPGPLPQDVAAELRRHVERAEAELVT